MKNKISVIIIGGGLAAIALFLAINFLPIFPSLAKYDIAIDPIIVKDEMGTETHVAIRNIGLYPITNLTVFFGGPTRPEVIPVLNPGEKISVSPPEGSDLKEVRVTADQGIDKTTQYRTPASATFVGNAGFGG